MRAQYGVFGVNCGGGGAGSGAGSAGCGGECGGGYANTTVLSYAGQGHGEYIAETNYKYVGRGAGDINMVEVQTKIGAGWCKWLLIFPMLLAILLLGLPIMGSNTTTTTRFVPEEPKTCSIYGDPHVVAFDGSHSDFYSSGEYWIVKSDTVWIQGRYLPTPITHGLAAVKAIAIGGPFLKGHKLYLDALYTTHWDDQTILSTFPGSFHSPDPLVHIEYNSQGKVLQTGRDGNLLHVLHITMPNGVSIQVNRWNQAGEGDYMNIEITMPPQPNQDGHCGIPDGDPSNDGRLEVRARLGKTGVAAQDLILPGPKTPIAVVANRPDINDCPPAMLEGAKASCRKGERRPIPSKECLIDVCFGGKIFAGEEQI